MIIGAYVKTGNEWAYITGVFVCEHDEGGETYVFIEHDGIIAPVIKRRTEVLVP